MELKYRDEMLRNAPTLVDVHKRNGRTPEFDTYIGRAVRFHKVFTKDSKWGNKFYRNLRAYEEHVRKNLWPDLDELMGKRLGCWCLTTDKIPASRDEFRCHGQVLMYLYHERQVILREKARIRKEQMMKERWRSFSAEEKTLYFFLFLKDLSKRFDTTKQQMRVAWEIMRYKCINGKCKSQDKYHCCHNYGITCFAAPDACNTCKGRGKPTYCTIWFCPEIEEQLTDKQKQILRFSQIKKRFVKSFEFENGVPDLPILRERYEVAGGAMRLPKVIKK